MAETQQITLTYPQRKVARLLLEGFSGAQIGSTLHISADAARMHTNRIYARVGVKSRIGLLLWLRGNPQMYERIRRVRIWKPMPGLP
jgi:DNA-binding CsgD family transcriptional regulator